MRLTAILALACLAGCLAMSPKELQDMAYRNEVESKQAAAQAVGCVARNLEREVQGLTANVRPAKDGGAWELVMRVPSAIASYFAYATVTPNGAGSTIELWLNPSTLGREELARKTLDGC